MAAFLYLGAGAGMIVLDIIAPILLMIGVSAFLFFVLLHEAITVSYAMALIVIFVALYDI